MLEVWIPFILLILTLAALDLFAFNPRGRPPTPTGAVAWALTYAVIALTFNVALYFMYHDGFMGLGRGPDGTVLTTGMEAWQKYLAALLMQTALGLDSVFVVLAVFVHFNTPEALRRRVLFYGIVLALAVQGLLIWGFGRLFDFTWARVALAVLLLLAAIRMLLIRQHNPDPEKNPLVRVLRLFIPVSRGGAEPGLLARENGRVAITPLLLALIVFETFDAFFALDGIPAVFALTQDPFLVFTAAAFSLLILRSLYLVLSTFTGWVRFMKVALALVLAYSAVLMGLPHKLHVPTGVSLIVVTTTLGAGLLVARLFRVPGPTPMTSPLGEDAEQLARTTLRHARRVQILAIGTTIVVLGIFMTVGPGPGLLVIPVGLAMLATEFAWARKALEKYSFHAQRALRVAGDITVRTPRPELVPTVIGAAIGLVAGALFLRPANIPAHWIMLVGTPILVFSGVWSFTNILKHREMTTGLTIRRDGSCPACLTSVADVPRTGEPFRCPRCATRLRDRVERSHHDHRHPDPPSA